jgi:hypothetical protein
MKPAVSLFTCLPLLLAGVTVAKPVTLNAQLHVAGRIVPGASCTVTVGDGSIDFGPIELESDPALPTKLPEMKVRMSISCGVATRYALVPTSSSSGDIANPKSFGLLSEIDQSLAGSFFVRIDSSSDHIEGRKAFHTGTDASLDLGSALWGPSTFSILPLGRGEFAIGFVTEDGSYATPSTIKDLDTYLLINPTIKPANELDRTDEIAFSGDLGFEIMYF